MSNGFDPSVLERRYRSRTHIFQDLMPFRVHRVLLVSSVYDSFILEEDARLDEGLVDEYVGLNLVHLPRMIRASTGAQALELARKPGGADLIITTMRLGDMNALELARRIREENLDIPVILLSYDSRELELLIRNRDTSDFEKVLLWQGDHRILLATIKLIEDRWNLASDTAAAGVQSIIVIEDSPRFYSALLPIIFSELMRHSQSVISESLDLSHRIMRMRARPKILLCHTYEQAWRLFDAYHENILGVISDVRFPRNGDKDARAGIDFAKAVREIHPDIPILLHSSEPENEALAEEIAVAFVEKGSPLLLNKVREFMVGSLSFGDFVFRTPDGQEVARASDLKSLERCLETVPDESLLYHARGNHFSNWLKGRTEFWLAHKLRPQRIEHFQSTEHLRRGLIQSMREWRVDQRRGAVADFDPGQLGSDKFFMRVGGGSLGGKGRGLAFVNKLIETAGIRRQFDGISITVPSALVVCTDLFDEFLDLNNLRDFVVRTDDDQLLLERFLDSELPVALAQALRAFVKSQKCPLAVRSSSLLEDSQHQPFAGIYRTVMLANEGARDVRYQRLIRAVKLVYASTFTRKARAYMEAASYRMEEEKMGVVIMHLVGARHGHRFYPDFSGVARSHNYYPVAPMKGEDGVAAVALGLGTFVVDGGACLRFCPAFPKHVIQFSSVEDTLNYSQREFHGLDLRGLGDPDLMTVGDPPSRFNLGDAEDDGVLWAMGSTYSPENDVIHDGIGRRGIRLVSFAPILKHGHFPLTDILQVLLGVGRWGMSAAVEIEFAVSLSVPPDERKQFRILQMRPMMTEEDWEDVSTADFEPSRLVCESRQVLGNGVIRGITDVVAVDIRRFSRSQTKQVAGEIALFNHELGQAGRPYILFGVGRWGSSDPWLGIPVSWNEISGARVIVESSFLDLRVTPSQGSHFFQNLATLKVGYFTIDPDSGGGAVDWEWLFSMPVEKERKLSRHIVLPEPLTVRMDGRTTHGVILKAAAP